MLVNHFILNLLIYQSNKYTNWYFNSKNITNQNNNKNQVKKCNKKKELKWFQNDHFA